MSPDDNQTSGAEQPRAADGHAHGAGEHGAGEHGAGEHRHEHAALDLPYGLPDWAFQDRVAPTPPTVAPAGPPEGIEENDNLGLPPLEIGTGWGPPRNWRCRGPM